MPAYGASMREISEGRAQIAFGAIIAVFFVALYFGKNLAGMPTPFGINLGDATNLAFDALWLALIVWVTISPPAGQNGWFLAIYISSMPLMHLLTNRQVHSPHLVALCDALVVIAGTLGGLSIAARLFLARKKKGG
jgi:hypothetical protein